MERSDSVRLKPEDLTVASLLAVQALVCIAYSYWLGFSLITNLNLVGRFSPIEIVGSIVDVRLCILLIAGMGLYAGSRFIYLPLLRITIRAFQVWRPAYREINKLPAWSMIMSVLPLTLLWFFVGPVEALLLSASMIALYISVSNKVLSVMPDTTASVKTGFPLLLSLVFYSAFIGASQAKLLIKFGQELSFSRVEIVFDGQPQTSTLIMSDGVSTVVMDDLRRFSVLSSSKISEIRYLPR